MSEDTSHTLLRAIEALHAEIKGMRDEMRADRADRDALTRLRKAGAERKARQRFAAVSRDSHGTEGQTVSAEKKDPASRDSHGTKSTDDISPATVTGQESRDSHGTSQVVKAVVVVRDLEQEQTTKNLSGPATVTGQKSVTGQKAERRTVPTREAYVAAYLSRWGVEPLINRKSNGQLAQFVDLLPADAAPAVAAFYVDHNWALYVNAKHPINLLLRDAPKLHTEWATNSPSTMTDAQQRERTAANINGWEKHLKGDK